MYEYAPTLMQPSYPAPSSPSRPAVRPLPPGTPVTPPPYPYGLNDETERVHDLPRAPRPAPRRQPAPRPRRLLKLTVGILVATAVIVGAVLGGLWFVQQRDAVPADTAVGSCVARSGADSITAVGCGDAAAQFRVISRVDGRTQAQAPAACATVKGATTTYWKGATGGVGTVLCLGPAKV
jgi:hypothetical protein